MAAAMLTTAQNIAIEKHPKKNNKAVQYGTAGFRTKAVDLDHVLYRMGLLAALRSRAVAATIGMMVTASHNPAPDNGVKLVDPEGEMLEIRWEGLATQLANVPDEELESVLSDIIKAENIDMVKSATVFIGQDTRPSSHDLAKSAMNGVRALKGEVVDFGLLTTPMLHYLVAAKNSQGEYGEPSVSGYFAKLSTAFRTFHEELRNEPREDKGNYFPNIVADMANGVGGPMMTKMADLIQDILTIEFFNTGEGELNHECGADFAKVRQSCPKRVRIKPKGRAVSFDGDADRIVYYYQDSAVKFHLLDGDRIATLVAGYLKDLLDTMGLTLNIGLVQTAYANGASTKYITDNLQIPVACVDTGVKHLHHKAKEFDIGIYFEANGHGTVLFSQKAKILIKAVREDKRLSGLKRGAARKLLAFIDMVNETTGDSISDLLLVESILHARGWSIEDWENSYTDLPNRQLAVTVQDRNVIEVLDPECHVGAPEGLQEAIDRLVVNFTDGRAFVRPSGTEDVVRVYAEARSQANADKLATLVARLVHQKAGGVGDPPTSHFK